MNQILRQACRMISLSAPLILLSAGAASAETEPADGAITYSGQVASILHERCADCHRPGQIGPMSLMNWEEVRPWAKSIRDTVVSRSMPPWFADPAHGEFRNDRRMTEAEIETVSRWVEGGAPRGNPALMPEPPVFTDAVWRMGTPDQVFTMSEPYVISDDLEDRYEIFAVPTNLTEDKWVIADEVRPGSFEAVHHVLVFVAPGDDDAFANAEGGIIGAIAGGLIRMDNRVGLFGKYAPGAHPIEWEPGTARLLPAGSTLYFQVHYHKEPGPGTGGTDRSSMAVRYADGPVRSPLTTAWLINPLFTIRPDQADASATSYFLFLDDGRIHSLAPHMHVRGRDFKFEAIYPGGRRETLLSVPKWDFNWQTGYVFSEPKRIPRGTVIRAEAHWDNTAANPDNPDPGATVRFGEATTDEMMIGFMDYNYDNAPFLQAQLGLPGEIDEAVAVFADEIGRRVREEVRSHLRRRVGELREAIEEWETALAR